MRRLPPWITRSVLTATLVPDAMFLLAAAGALLGGDDWWRWVAGGAYIAMAAFSTWSMLLGAYSRWLTNQARELYDAERLRLLEMMEVLRRHEADPLRRPLIYPN